MAKFYSLFSSSSGNAAYLGNAAAGILLDIGVSCRKLCTALQERSLSPDAIQAVCITHTHIDHIRGLAVFLRKHPVPVYGTEETLQTLERQCDRSDLFHAISCGQLVSIAGNWEVTAFPTPHDAEGSCGYRIHTSDDRLCAVCTDLGEVTPEVQAGVIGCDMVLLESNYEEALLQSGPYPYYLKKRIQGREGHLSNVDSANFAKTLMETGTTRLILGHLSPHNNTPYHAEQAALTGLQAMVRNRDYLLEVAAPDGCREAVIF